MSKKCKAFSESKIGLEPPDNRKAFYAGWDAAIEQAEKPMAKIEQAERDLIPQNKLLVAGQLGAHVTRVREERQWQGLTTDEVFECQEASYMDTYSNIEAKLKEKNT